LKEDLVLIEAIETVTTAVTEVATDAAMALAETETVTTIVRTTA
jgi:hypothetical protein